MPNVNLYIAATARGPSIRKKAYYVYILEWMPGDSPYTRVGHGSMENVTENQITLTALIEALKRFTEPCDITVYTECKHVINSMMQAWPQHWNKCNWIKPATGKPVQNKELWQQILVLTKKHCIAWTDTDHSYKQWMMDELKRMKEADNG